MKELDEYIKDNVNWKHKLILETGCARYGPNEYKQYIGGVLTKVVPGTYIFSELANEHDIKFYCVDWNSDQIEIAKRHITNENTEFVCAATHDYLTHLVEEKIKADFIYLDSSNDMHYILKEFKLSLELVDVGSVICIDDYRADKCTLIEKYMIYSGHPYEADAKEYIRAKMYIKFTEEMITEMKTSFPIFYNQYDWAKLDSEFRENQHEYENNMSYINIGMDT